MKKTVEKVLTPEERQHNYNAKYYAEHREQERKRVAEYKKQHKDELREKNKEYRERNADRIKAYRDTPRMKEYQKSYQQMYRAKKKAETELMKQAEGEKMVVKKNIVSDSLSIWIGVKALIDIQTKTEDFSEKNFEDMLFEVGDTQILNEISCSSFLWQRAFNYFSCKQREIIRDNFCKENNE